MCYLSTTSQQFSNRNIISFQKRFLEKKTVFKQENGASCVPRLHGLVAGEMEHAHLAAQQIPRLCVYMTYHLFITCLYDWS
jgi:hypothetical protein